MSSSLTLFVRLETYALKHRKKLRFAFPLITLLLALANFNAGFSDANDDSAYVEAAWKYVHEFPHYQYTFNAPLYPMFLALLCKGFGFKILLFKIINVLLYTFSVLLFWKAFEHNISYSVLIPVTLFLSVNHLLLYYASMTFTEAFYLFMQSLLLYFVSVFSSIPADTPFKKKAGYWAIAGILMVLISITKNIAILVLPAFILIFLLKKQWKNAAWGLISFSIFRGLYELLIHSIWEGKNQFSGQIHLFMRKDYYDATKGAEDFSGYLDRFVVNTQLYLGKCAPQIMGFLREDAPAIKPFSIFIIIALIGFGGYLFIKNKNAFYGFCFIYTILILLFSFVILQTRWEQPRIILIGMPVLLITFFYTLYTISLKYPFVQPAYIIILVISCGSLIKSTYTRTQTHYPIAKQHLKGNVYAGFTPDWVNFLKGSRWCNDSLPSTALVASRKAPMSFVYSGGKKFFPVYSVIKRDSLTNEANPDSALAFLQKNKVTHILLAQLRLNPKISNGQIIGTMHDIVRPILNKYPQKLTLVHTEGTTEPCHIIRLNY